MPALASFLERNSARVGKSLPLVHTTRAYFLKKILETQRIETIRCDVYKEDLAYFFVGRPAYKWDTDGEATEWELPVCFIFEYDIKNAARVFPFDTGAFRKGLCPSYMKMMDVEDFNIKAINQGPERVIGTFFSSPRDYYLMKPRPEHKFFDEFLVDIFDSEVKALHRLMSNASKAIDDRRCAIEVQFDKAVSLDKGKLLAIIAPDIYLEHSSVKKFVKSNRISAFGYSVFTLNSAAFFSQIYSYAKRFYEKRGLLSV